jgi:nucleoside triphosphate diphosphatase
LQGEAASEDRTTAVLDRALALVRFLRANCPWDAAQTPTSLVPYLLEEAHEVADAVSDGDDATLPSELGDLLLNVAFQIVLAEERGAFDAANVVGALESKMRRRHPHLYGDGPAQAWETLKHSERLEAGEGESVLGGLARGLDPLSKAHRIQERVSGVGFDWADASGAFAKVAEELEEVREAMETLAIEPSESTNATAAVEEELGDLLFAVVNLTRLVGVHSLRALQQANAKFTSRFEQLEELARERGIVPGEASLEELDALWDEVKARRR